MLFKYVLYRKRVKTIFLQHADKDQIFKATPRLYSCGFFVFITTFYIGFTRTEKEYVKFIDNDTFEKETFEIFDCIPWFTLHGFICVLRYLTFGSFFFNQFEATFDATFYAYNKKPLFRSAETSFLQLIGTSLVEKVAFSLRNVNKQKKNSKKKKANRKPALMWHSFQQIKIKIIK